jgi:predicted NBD/HSP70 family sugar kinase
MILAIDIGGSKIRYILFKDGKMVKKRMVQTTPENFQKVLELSYPKALSVAGWVKNNRIIRAPNIKWLEGLELRRNDILLIENDANCFAFAEAKRFGVKNLIGITVGTGIGGGIVIEGKLYRGEGFAGEFGHSVFKINGKKCSCGNRGCLEEYVSKRAIEREARKVFGRKIEPKVLASIKYEKAVNIFRKIGKLFGLFLTSVINIFDPEVISIGGGIGRNQIFFNEAKKEALRNTFSKPTIVKGDNLSPAIGAWLLSKE